MLGGSSMISYQASHGQGGTGLSGRRPPMTAHRERDNSGSRNGLRSNPVPKIVEGTPQAWLQDLLQTVEGGTRSLGEQFKAIDTRSRDWIMKLRTGVLENKRGNTGRRVNVQRLCFASISNPFNKKEQSQAQEKVEDIKESAEKLGEESRLTVPETKVVGIGKVKSLVLKQILCGILAGAIASFAIAPFQVLRTRVVAGQGGSSAVEVMHTVTEHEGIQSLMKGDFLVTLVSTSMQKGVQFAVYEGVKRKEEEKVGQDPKLIDAVPRKAPISTVAGAAAGLASTLVVYPLQVLMDRLLLQPEKYTSVLDSVVKVVGESGFSELYRGVVPAVLTMVPQVALGFFTYETLSEKMKAAKWHPTSASLTAGALAGVVSTTLTYPLEAARKQISVSAVTAVHFDTTYNNLFQALGGIVQHDGLAGLYKGFGVEALQVIPVTAISFLVYELAKRALVAQHEERRDEVKG